MRSKRKTFFAAVAAVVDRHRWDCIDNYRMPSPAPGSPAPWTYEDNGACFIVKHCRRLGAPCHGRLS